MSQNLILQQNFESKKTWDPKPQIGAQWARLRARQTSILSRITGQWRWEYSDHTHRNQAMQTDQIVARLCLLATPAHVPPVKQDTGQFHQLLSGVALMDQHRKSMRRPSICPRMQSLKSPKPLQKVYKQRHGQVEDEEEQSFQHPTRSICNASKVHNLFIGS